MGMVDWLISNTIMYSLTKQLTALWEFEGIWQLWLPYCVFREEMSPFHAQLLVGTCITCDFVNPMESERAQLRPFQENNCPRSDTKEDDDRRNFVVFAIFVDDLIF